jgi:hypothetical protein
MAEESTLNARVYVSDGTTYQFPEMQPGVLPAVPQTAVCFSGGGTRALSAAEGQLRGLIAEGLLGKVGIISCVSGGSWAATAFTFYQSGAANDGEFLGPVTEPGAITWANLNTLPASRLGSTATLDFRGALLKNLDHPSVRRDEVWIQAVGQIFFAPFGLYDLNNPAYFSLDAATVADIKSRNPSLAVAPFVTPRENRPFLVINSTLIWPVDDLRHENTVGFEYTPLAAGTPFLLKIASNPVFGPPVYRTVGGGLVEPFAFGAPGPTAAPVNGLVQLTPPSAPYTVVQASGTSSSAYAAIFDEADASLSPHELYWPVSNGAAPPTFSYAFGDGGNIENFGVISMLRRKIPRIVVFVNTEVKLSLTYKPAADNPPSTDDIDDDIPALFGMKVKEFLRRDEDPFPHNQVFPTADFATVVQALQKPKSQGKPVVAVTEHTVQANDWWGVEGGWTVQVCWVYLDRVAAWEAQVTGENGAIQKAIDEGNASLFPTGPFRFFPNYKTIDEDHLDIVQFTPQQVNLLGDLTCWVVRNSPEIAETLGGERT